MFEARRFQCHQSWLWLEDIRPAHSFFILNFTPQAPVVLSPVLHSNLFLFSFGTVPGQAYVTEYKNQLTEENWIPLQTNTGDGGTATVTNVISAGPQRFFRLRLQ